MAQPNPYWQGAAQPTQGVVIQGSPVTIHNKYIEAAAQVGMLSSMAQLWWLCFLGTSWAQSPGFGVWHLVDVLSVICPGGPGYATITMSKPTTAEYEPHILTIFRTAKNPVQLNFIARDARGIIADQRQGVSLQGHARRARRLAEEAAMAAPATAQGLQFFPTCCSYVPASPAATSSIDAARASSTLTPWAFMTVHFLARQGCLVLPTPTGTVRMGDEV
eukprot:g32876.t1